MTNTDTRTTWIFSRARIPVLLVIAATMLLVVGAPRRAVAGADPDGVTIVDPDRKVFGKTYSELAGDWWNWAAQGPFETFPLFDETGDNCDVGQQGPIWFLAGNFGGVSERSCTVPNGKAIFFPVVNTIWWAPEDGETVEELRAIANSFIDPGSLTLSCEIDGEPVSDLFSYRAQSPTGGFVFDIPAGSVFNTFGFDPGLRDPSVSDGYWIGLAPLPGGDHTIHFTAVVGDPDDPDFALDVTYFLSTGVECPWDVNGDGAVDFLDFLQVLFNFGPCDGCPADVNGDGVVNVLDLLAVLAHFGPCP